MVRLKKFPAIGYRGFFAGVHVGKVALVSQRIHNIWVHAGFFGRCGMGVPNVLAVHFPGGDQHGQLLNLFGQGRIIPQVLIQRSGQLVGLRHVDHHGTRSILGYRAQALQHFVKGGPLSFGHRFSGCRRQSGHGSHPPEIYSLGQNHTVGPSRG